MRSVDAQDHFPNLFHSPATVRRSSSPTALAVHTRRGTAVSARTYVVVPDPLPHPD